MNYDMALARRIALILGMSFASLSSALADGRAVLPPKQLVQDYLSGVSTVSRDLLVMSMIPGAMGVAMHQGGAAPVSVDYIGTAAILGTTAAPSGTISWPAGTAAGDIAISVNFNNQSAVTTGWNADFTGVSVSSSGDVFWSGRSKILTSTDISTPPTYAGGAGGFGPWAIFVYRGASSIVFKSAPSLSLVGTGFTKNSGSARIISVSGDRSTSGSTMSPPSGFTERYEARSSYFDVSCADIAPISYTNGASMTWTDANSSVLGNSVATYEMVA